MVRMQGAEIPHIREVGLGDEVDDAPVEVSLLALEYEAEGLARPGARTVGAEDEAGVDE